MDILDSTTGQRAKGYEDDEGLGVSVKKEGGESAGSLWPPEDKVQSDFTSVYKFCTGV